jgi:tetratricopeptide (TPR) repeat protein
MELKEEKIEKFGRGEITLAELMNVTPRQEAALVSLGYAYYSQGRLEDAANILKGLATMDGDFGYVYSLLGSIYQKKSDYDAAIECYTRALTIDPHDTYCLANRGEIFLRQGRFNEASTDLHNAINTDPDGKHPAANRARLLVVLTHEATKAISQ